MGKELTRQMIATKTRLHLSMSPTQGGLQNQYGTASTL